MLDFIVFSLFIIALVGVIINNIILRITKTNISNFYIQSELDKFALSEKLSKINAEKDTVNVERTEGFLKFVSESRDWAFSYIEDVQAAILKLEKAILEKDRIKIKAAEKEIINFLPKKEEEIK